MNQTQHLFAEPDLDVVLRSLLQKISGYVDSIPEQKFTQTSQQELVEQVYKLAEVKLVALDETAIEKKVEETEVDVSRDPLRFLGSDHSGPFYVSGLRVTWNVPFTGEEGVFDLRTNPFSSSLPQGRVERGKLFISLSLPNDEDSDRFKGYFESQMKLIRKYLGYANKQIEQHNQGLFHPIKEAIDIRSARLKKREEVEGKI